MKRLRLYSLIGHNPFSIQVYYYMEDIDDEYLDIEESQSLFNSGLLLQE